MHSAGRQRGFLIAGLPIPNAADKMPALRINLPHGLC
jgi:hypothetical protein